MNEFEPTIKPIPYFTNRTKVEIYEKDKLVEEYYTEWTGHSVEKIKRKYETDDYSNLSPSTIILGPLWTNFVDDTDEVENDVTEKSHTKGRRCAICDKPVKNADICNKCFKEHCPDGVYPDWVKALVEIESHVQRYVEPREIANSELSTDSFDYLDNTNFEDVGTGRKVKKAPTCDENWG